MSKVEVSFDYLVQIRLNFINLIKGLSEDELNKIPENFSNNIIWNFAHVLVTQQLLCYKLSKNKLLINHSIVDKFRKGTRAEAYYDMTLVNELIDLGEILPLRTKKDFQKGILSTNFETYHTSFGLILNSINDAIVFNNVHESLHLGYAMGLRKAL